MFEISLLYGRDRHPDSNWNSIVKMKTRLNHDVLLVLEPQDHGDYHFSDFCLAHSLACTYQFVKPCAPVCEKSYFFFETKGYIFRKSTTIMVLPPS